MAVNKTLKEEDSKRLAQNNIKKQIILDEIAGKEKIEVSDSELSRRKASITHREVSDEELRDEITREKVLKFLMENAKRVDCLLG